MRLTAPLAAGLALILGCVVPAAAQETKAALDDALGEEAAPAGTRSKPRVRPAKSPWRMGVDGVLAEVGAATAHPTVDGVWTLRAAPYVLWQPSKQWEARASVLADGSGQTGTPDYTRWRADLADTYLRWRSGDTRLTAGAQTVIWGRVDGVPLIDRVSRVDLTRILLDDLPDRRRAQWALRWEQNWEDLKLDAVVLPAFMGAEMPTPDSLWSPVNRQTGRIFGITAAEPLAMLVRQGHIDQRDGGFGGVGMRLTRTGGAFDYGLTWARTRQSMPYYEADFIRSTLTAVHPFVNFVGLDAEVVWADATWRTEIGFTQAAPLTSTFGQRVDSKALEWVGAVEFFPGGKSTRVNLQLLARKSRVDAEVLELKRYVGVNGEVETTLGQGRWKLALQFASGLNVHDLYLGPRISYTGWEPHEFYVAAHHFRGNERTLGGFFRDHDVVSVGVKTRF